MRINDADVMLVRMGELEPWIDENFVRSVWFNMGEQVNVKMIRDKFSGYVVPFRTRQIACAGLTVSVMLAIVSLISQAPLPLQRP